MVRKQREGGRSDDTLDTQHVKVRREKKNSRTTDTGSRVDSHKQSMRTWARTNTAPELKNSTVRRTMDRSLVLVLYTARVWATARVPRSTHLCTQEKKKKKKTTPGTLT